MSATWFEVTTAAGERHAGVVQGSGGKIGYSFSHLEQGERESASADRLLKAIRRADAKEDTGLFEPKPGHCALYPYYSGAGDGPFFTIPLAGASIKVVKPRRFAAWCRLCVERYPDVTVMTGFVGTDESECQLCERRTVLAIVEKPKGVTS